MNMIEMEYYHLVKMKMKKSLVVANINKRIVTKNLF